MDIDQSTPQQACCKGHHFLVRGLAVTDINYLKLQSTLGSLCNLLQLGEVKALSKRLESGSLQLEFACSGGNICVKNINLEIDGMPYQPALNTENNIQAVRDDGTIQNTQDVQIQKLESFHISESQRTQRLASDTESVVQSQQNHSAPSPTTATVQDWQSHAWSHISEFQSPTSQPKFQMLTGVQLDLKALLPNLHTPVDDLIRLNDLKSSFPIDGKVTIEGPFEAVERFYRGVINLQNNVSDEMLHDTPRGNEATMNSHNRELDSTKEEDSNTLRLPLFHYEYLNKVWADKISAFQASHQVDILPEVILKLQDKGGQGHTQVKKALDALTNSIQPMITDLGQTKFSISETERPYMVNAFMEIQKNKPLFTLMELEEEYAIIGPKSNLKQVKDELMELVKSKSRPKAILKIENKMSTVLTEMDIPMPHWAILENLFKKELTAINSIYQVLIEPEVQPYKDKVKILVKNQCATQDLSGNALQAFVSLYQQAMTSCIARAVDSLHTDRVRVLYNAVRFSHQGVLSIVPEGGGLALIGLPQHVEVAIRDIEERLGGNVFPRPPPGSGGDGGWLSTSVPAQRKKEANGTKDEEENCCICMDTFKEKITTRCNHSFCKACWEQSIAVKPECPICKTTYGKIEGDQPNGTMSHTLLKHTSLPGFDFQCGTIEITYNFPSGFQSPKHPCPGQSYMGTTRRAYLPDNAEGHNILRMLKQAFKQRLIFTVGESRTSGFKNVVTWNDIHHKTSQSGGPTQFGYPDPDYLRRVREELRAKGIE